MVRSNGASSEKKTALEDNSVELSSDEDERKPSFVYRHDGGTVELHLASLECLQNESAYLKDNVVQFYSAYLLNTTCDKSIRSRVHIFDSIFSEQLTKVFGKARIDGARFHQVRKWYDGVDLFEKDFIVFPICSGDHWFAIVACYHGNVGDFTATGSKTSAITKAPALIVLDSLGLKGSSQASRILDLLDFEWRTRCTTVKRFSCHDLKKYTAKLPKQTNAYDCGFYMLAYIECFLQDPDKFYQTIRERKRDPGLGKRIDETIKKNSRTALQTLISKVCEQI